MKPKEDKIDEALDAVLKASGSALKHYSMPVTIKQMREVMRKIMSESYIQGSNDCFEALMNRKEK